MTSWQALGVSLAALWAVEVSAADESCSPGSVLAQLQAGGFVRIDRISGVSSNVLGAFWHAIPNHAPDPQSFADPDEEFQATDVVSTPPLPWRRLIFGGRSPSITFIYYEKGGRGLSRHLFATCSQGASIHSFSYLSPRQAEDAPTLLRGLEPACFVAPPREHLERAEVDRCL